jgi:hypothetical protein
MFALTGGEIFILGFIVVAVVSWPWWPKVGESVAMLLAGDKPSGAPAADRDPPNRSA